MIWDVVLCSSVDMYQHFGGTCCLHSFNKERIYLEPEYEVAGFSKILEPVYQTTLCDIPEGIILCHLRLNMEEASGFSEKLVTTDKLPHCHDPKYNNLISLL
jgi:hypothetical protein